VSPKPSAGDKGKKSYKKRERQGKKRKTAHRKASGKNVGKNRGTFRGDNKGSRLRKNVVNHEKESQGGKKMGRLKKK